MSLLIFKSVEIEIEISLSDEKDCIIINMLNDDGNKNENIDLVVFKESYRLKAFTKRASIETTDYCGTQAINISDNVILDRNRYNELLKIEKIKEKDIEEAINKSIRSFYKS